MNLDPYARLGVSREVTDAEIKKAFRVLAKKHHPDLGGDPTVFDEIRLANDVLLDPERRAAYDATGKIEPTESDNRAAAAMQCLCSAVVGAIEECDDPDHRDLAEEVRNALIRMHEGCTKSLADTERKLARITRARNRFTTGGKNQIEPMLAFHANNLAENVKRHRSSLETIAEAQKLAAAYRYRFDIIQQVVFQQQRPVYMGGPYMDLRGQARR